MWEGGRDGRVACLLVSQIALASQHSLERRGTNCAGADVLTGTG